MQVGAFILVGNKHARRRMYTTVVGCVMQVTEVSDPTIGVSRIVDGIRISTWYIHKEDALPIANNNKEALFVLKDAL